jgi:hypothetical protein
MPDAPEGQPSNPSATILPEWLSLIEAVAWIVIRDAVFIRCAPHRHLALRRLDVHRAWNEKMNLETGPSTDRAMDELLAKFKKGAEVVSVHREALIKEWPETTFSKARAFMFNLAEQCMRDGITVKRRDALQRCQKAAACSQRTAIAVWDMERSERPGRKWSNPDRKPRLASA